MHNNTTWRSQRILIIWRLSVNWSSCAARTRNWPSRQPSRCAVGPCPGWPAPHILATRYTSPATCPMMPMWKGPSTSARGGSAGHTDKKKILYYVPPRRCTQISTVEQSFSQPAVTGQSFYLFQQTERQRDGTSYSFSFKISAHIGIAHVTFRYVSVYV